MASPNTGPRACVIGLDGVPHGLVTRYAADGTMPNLGKVLKTGTLRKMASSSREGESRCLTVISDPSAAWRSAPG